MGTLLKVIGLGFVVGAVIAFKTRKRRSSLLEEQDDMDAYNGDDQQPPFEEKSPRQRVLAG